MCHPAEVSFLRNDKGQRRKEAAEAAQSEGMRVLSFGIWQGQHAQSHISGLHNLYHSQLQMQHLLQREVSREQVLISGTPKHLHTDHGEL